MRENASTERSGSAAGVPTASARIGPDDGPVAVEAAKRQRTPRPRP